MDLNELEKENTIICKRAVPLLSFFIKYQIHWFVGFFVLNATFNNISVISWRLVLLVEETGLPGENHRPVVSCIRYNDVSRYMSKRVSDCCVVLSKKNFS